jgi:hypothetical protein
MLYLLLLNLDPKWEEIWAATQVLFLRRRLAQMVFQIVPKEKVKPTFT